MGILRGRPCNTAGVPWRTTKHTPAGFSARDLLDRLQELGRLDVSFPIPSTALEPDLSDVEVLMLASELSRHHPIMFVEERAGADTCSLERYVRVPIQVRLSDPGGRFEAAGLILIAADSLEPSSWVIEQYTHDPALQGTLAADEVERLTAAMSLAQGVPMSMDPILVGWRESQITIRLAYRNNSDQTAGVTSGRATFPSVAR